MAKPEKRWSAFSIELRRASLSPSLLRVEVRGVCRQDVGWGSAFGEVIKVLVLYSGSSTTTLG